MCVVSFCNLRLVFTIDFVLLPQNICRLESAEKGTGTECTVHNLNCYFVEIESFKSKLLNIDTRLHILQQIHLFVTNRNVFHLKCSRFFVIEKRVLVVALSLLALSFSLSLSIARALLFCMQSELTVYSLRTKTI